MPWCDWHFWAGWLTGNACEAVIVFALWQWRKQRKPAPVICLSMEKIRRHADAANSRSK